MKPQNPALSLALTKAMAYNENGGAPNLKDLSAGQSGELKSIFQYEPGTWKAVAGKYLGNPDAPLTPDDETIATTARVSDWLDRGYSPEQILSMQNAGPGEPDAYTGKFSDGSSSSGTNKYGVKYNVSGYVDKGMKYLSEFEPDLASKVTPNTGLVQSGDSTSQIAPHTEPTTMGATDPLTSILSTLGNTIPSKNPATAKTSPVQGPQVAGVLAGPQKA